MQRAVTVWLSHQVDIDHKSDGSAARLTLRVTCKAIVLACLINAVVHCALDQVGLLPYPLTEALFVGLVTTAAITFVVSLVMMTVIGRAIRDLSIQRDAFENLSRTDALSGLCNRRAFFERFTPVPETGRLILIDIDRFKVINDTYGHPAGDEVICRVGQTLRSMFAGTPAVIGRIGGEEFAVFLPGISSGAWDSAEAIRASVAALTIEEIKTGITVSLGVAATYPPRPAVEAYSAADRALYSAKSGGRNRVVHEGERGILPHPPATIAVEGRPLSGQQPESTPSHPMPVHLIDLESGLDLHQHATTAARARAEA